MKVTEQQLLAIMPFAKRNVGGDLTRHLNYINTLCEEFDITSPKRMGMLLAQIAHESGELRYTEEIASGAAYEGRKDLGNTKAGDGVRFKGRGFIQITGRANYAAYKAYCGYDVVSKPWLLSQPKGAWRSAMWFFKTHGCNELADKEDLRGVTKRINGGYNGWGSRLIYWNRAKLAIK